MFFAELNVKFLFYPDVKSEKKQTNINSLSIPSTSLGGVILSRKVGKKKPNNLIPDMPVIFLL